MEQTIEAPVEEAKERILTATDRCDNCGAQAFVRARFITGELDFCGHHFNKGEQKIRESALEIVDEREFINVKPSQSSF